jgi:hypothetical protein
VFQAAWQAIPTGDLIGLRRKIAVQEPRRRIPHQCRFCDMPQRDRRDAHLRWELAALRVGEALQVSDHLAVRGVGVDHPEYIARRLLSPLAVRDVMPLEVVRDRLLEHRQWRRAAIHPIGCLARSQRESHGGGRK